MVVKAVPAQERHEKLQSLKQDDDASYIQLTQSH